MDKGYLYFNKVYLHTVAGDRSKLTIHCYNFGDIW